MYIHILAVQPFTILSRSYTKQRLTALHPNIMVQRSPSHFQTGTFYWAHVSTLYALSSRRLMLFSSAREVVCHRSSDCIHGRLGSVLRTVGTSHDLSLTITEHLPGGIPRNTSSSTTRMAFQRALNISGLVHTCSLSQVLH